MEFPQDFRCPISMELMKEPVIISTGVTYERKNIEKWFFGYNMKTCPFTSQSVEHFYITPNYTLKRRILEWQHTQSSSYSRAPSSLPLSSLKKRYDMASFLQRLMWTSHKVSYLKKLQEMIKTGDKVKHDFIKEGGLQVVYRLIVHILDDGSNFKDFRACEEALRVLQHLPLLQEDGEVIELFSRPGFIKSMVIILQSGRKEAKASTISIFTTLINSNFNWDVVLNDDQGIGVLKSILKLASVDVSTDESSFALQLILKILDSSKRIRSMAIEADAMYTLIELLPDSNGSKCEDILHIIKLLCECNYGKMELNDCLGLGVISSKLFNGVSFKATKICLDIFLLICGSYPTRKVFEETIIYGEVKKPVIPMHMSTPSSTKDKKFVMFEKRSHSRSRYPCVPRESKRYHGPRHR